MALIDPDISFEARMNITADELASLRQAYDGIAKAAGDAARILDPHGLEFVARAARKDQLRCTYITTNPDALMAICTYVSFGMTFRAAVDKVMGGEPADAQVSDPAPTRHELLTAGARAKAMRTPAAMSDWLTARARCDLAIAGLKKSAALRDGCAVNT